METGPRHKVSSDGLVKPGIEPAIPGSQGKRLSTKPQRLLHKGVVLFVCFVALCPKSTAMVMAGRSVRLITLFPGQA